MNTELLELAASTLGELADRVVFVGGATVGLWISEVLMAAVKRVLRRRRYCPLHVGARLAYEHWRAPRPTDERDHDEIPVGAG